MRDAGTKAIFKKQESEYLPWTWLLNKVNKSLKTNPSKKRDYYIGYSVIWSNLNFGVRFWRLGITGFIIIFWHLLDLYSPLSRS